MPNNRIDGVLTAEDIDAILGAVNTIRQRMPYLVGLTTAERMRLPKMGDKSRAFVSKALEIATQSPGLLSAERLGELRRDVELTTAMQPVRVAITQMAELVNDSCLLAGSEAVSGALAVYEMAKRAGQDEALDALTRELRRRFEKAPATAQPPEPAS